MSSPRQGSGWFGVSSLVGVFSWCNMSSPSAREVFEENTAHTREKGSHIATHLPRDPRPAMAFLFNFLDRSKPSSLYTSGARARASHMGSAFGEYLPRSVWLATFHQMIAYRSDQLLVTYTF
jgi:hypothetical protein